jgi:hypothetical protein
MVLQSGLGLSRADTLAYAASVIDVVVVLGREGGSAGSSISPAWAAAAATSDRIAAPPWGKAYPARWVTTGWKR